MKTKVKRKRAGEKNKKIKTLIDIMMSISLLRSLSPQCQNKSLHYLEYLRWWVHFFINKFIINRPLDLSPAIKSCQLTHPVVKKIKSSRWPNLPVFLTWLESEAARFHWLINSKLPWIGSSGLWKLWTLSKLYSWLILLCLKSMVTQMYIKKENICTRYLLV